MLDGAKRDRQRGEGKLGGIISLLALGCFIFALVNVGPAYFADYNLGDQMREVARLARGRYSDDEIKDKLMRAVTDSGLETWVDRSSFEVDTRESTRRIKLEYVRELTILPGWKKTVTFTRQVDEPFF